MKSTTIRSGLSPFTEKPIEISIADGRIVDAVSAQDRNSGRWIAPGLIDLQVNGFAGVDYNSPTAPQDEIARSIEAQRATGVTRLLPTVITGSTENITGSLQNLARARRELANGKAIAGFHVEGPWISPTDGPRGAHPREHVRPPSFEEFQRFQEAAEGGVRLITLAPEIPGAIAVIERLTEAGVTVAIGHTGADADALADAIRAGATMSTHLGNGAHSQIARHENYILRQMAADELAAGLIVDGIHLPPHFVKVAVRAKGLDRIALVTDAAPPAGAKPGVYRFGHIEVRLTAEDRVELTASGRLAGSALSLDRGVANLIRFSDCELADALRAATSTPAKLIGLEDRLGLLEPGDAADLILFDFDADSGRIAIRETLAAYD